MTDFDFFKSKGEGRIFGPTSYLNLYSESAYFCFIESGELDLYFLESEPEFSFKTHEFEFDPNIIQGQLHFLRTIKTQNLLLSFPYLHSLIKIIARPTIETTLFYLPVEDLIHEINKENEKFFLSDVEVWFNGFAKEIAFFPLPEQIKEFSQGEIILEKEEPFVVRDSLSPETKFQLFWLQLKEGKIVPLGIEELSLSPDAHLLYPVIRDLWFKTLSLSVIEAFILPSFEKKQWKGWVLFFQHLIKMLEIQNEQSKNKEKELLLQKKLIGTRNMQLAESQLQTALDKEVTEFAQEGRNLLSDTCQFIGNKLNLKFDLSSEINPALSSKEQVETLCFDSHVYHRMIFLSPYWWKINIGPLLGFSKESKKPVALIPEHNRYSIVDLEQSSSKEVNSETVEGLSTDAFEFYRAFPLKPELTGRDLIAFGSFQKWGIFIGIFFLSLTAALLNLFFPFFNAALFDIAIPNDDRSLLLQIVIGMLMITVGNEMFILSREYLIVKLEGFLDREFESAIWQRILDLPLRFFRRFQIGDLLLRVFSVNTIRRKISEQGLRVTLNSVFSIMYLIPMFYYSIGLSFAGIGIVLVGILFSFWAIIKNLNYNRQMLDLKGKMNDQVLQLLSGISKIHIYGAENIIFVFWEKVFYLIKRLEWKMQKVNNITELVNFVISNLGTLVIYVAALILILNTEHLTALTMGHFLAFLAAFGPFSYAVGDLSNTFLESIELVPLWRKSQVLFRTPIEMDTTKSLTFKVKGHIHLDHVSFRYDKNSPYIFNNISMEIQEGEFVGIVGHSGCGKSTLVRLLVGFEAPESGAIYFDNVDSETLDLRKLRKQIGIVLQTSALIDGTIRENVAAGGYYSDEQIRHALRLAGFEEELKRLPMDINTLLMDKGNTLSGGQRQRLLIARALIGQPKILIFDEATNALDNTTQELIAQTLDKLNATRIIIAHRLSRIRKADKIYVLQEGKIQDSGTFEELAQRKGIFADLLEKQKVS